MRARIILGLVASVALAVPAWAEEADAPRLPAAGTRLAARPVRAAESAVVHFGDLARADAARRAIEGALTPLAILQGEETVEGEDEALEPLTPTPLESYRFPVPGLAPLVPSPSPAQSFMGLDDIPRVGTNVLTIPPDVDGAVGPSVILEGLNNNYRFYDKATGAGLGTTSITSFWAAAGGTGLFDPRLLYDPVQQRWIAVTLSDSRSRGAWARRASARPTSTWPPGRCRSRCRSRTTPRTSRRVPARSRRSGSARRSGCSPQS